MVSALALVTLRDARLWLGSIRTAISRGMKVMQHDIYSRGMTEPIATTLAFLLALAVGFKESSPEVAAIVGTAASGVIALALASTLFRHVPPQKEVVSTLGAARALLGFAAPISIYQLINAFIARLDLIMLGYFVGRAPGVTLATVGVYSAVVSTADGLRKVNQSFNPIFAPVVASMTATGDHDVAAATYARLAQWMLWILLPLVAVMSLAGGTILLIYGPAFRQGGVLSWHRRFRQCHQCVCGIGRNCNHGPTAAFESSAFCRSRARLRRAACFGSFPALARWARLVGILLPYIVQGILRYATLRWVFHWKDSWSDIRHTADCRRNRVCSRSRLPCISGRNCRTNHQRCDFFGSVRCSVVGAPYAGPNTSMPRVKRRRPKRL